MTTLTIRRLGAAVPADLEQADLARVDRLLRLVASGALEERDATFGDLSGDWFVRRIDLQLDLASDESESRAAGRLASLIADAVRDLVPDGINVLHFRSRSRLLLDVTVGLTTGDTTRAWAWRQAGLLTPADPDPVLRPGAALLAALGREPRLAVPVLVRTVERTSIRAVDAALGPDGWAALAGLVRPGWRASSTSISLAPPAAHPTPPHPVSAHLAQRAAAVLAASSLASAVRSGLPTVDDGTASALAVLVLTEADPAADLGPLEPVAAGLTSSVSPGPRPAAAESRAPGWRNVAPRPGTVGEELPIARAAPTRPPSGGTAVEAGGSGRQDAQRREGQRPPIGAPGPVPARLPAGEAPTAIGDAPARLPGGGVGSSLEEAAPGGALLDDDPLSQPQDSDAERGVSTNWAGLLFVLNAADPAHLPEAIETDARLAGRPRWWVLHQLALRLVPVAADDPAARAFAGLTPTMPQPDGPPADPVEEEALDVHAAELAAAVDLLLERSHHPDDDAPPPTLWLLARRRGWIVADPGWIEVQLSLDDVDFHVRRAGLDLDPGWLGWLGTVVVFRYV